MNVSDPGFRHLYDADAAPAGRDPLGKTIAETFIERHPGWSDQEIAARVNAEAGTTAITADEVAHWRAEAAR